VQVEESAAELEAAKRESAASVEEAAADARKTEAESAAAAAEVGLALFTLFCSQNTN
jgi:hypothetical protein